MEGFSQMRNSVPTFETRASRGVSLTTRLQVGERAANLRLFDGRRHHRHHVQRQGLSTSTPPSRVVRNFTKFEQIFLSVEATRPQVIRLIQTNLESATPHFLCDLICYEPIRTDFT